MRFVFLGLVAGLALAGCQTTEHRPGEIPGAYPGQIIVYNRATSPIVEIAFRPTGYPDWYAANTPLIPSGDKVGINLRDIPICLWDLQFTTGDNAVEEYIGIDFCSVSSARFPKE